MTLAPIVLFVYNRLDHTIRTVEALKQNELSQVSELYVYSDAPKKESDQAMVSEVRDYIRSISGFRKVFIIERKHNFGLARSIIEGVSEVIQRNGKVIVLEDDIVTSPFFLKFMNEALEFYLNEKKVWHISGWNYPIDNSDLEDVFFWRFMNCWGWATWSDRWKYFEKQPNKTLSEFSRTEIKKFNLDGAYDFFDQVIRNSTQEINTWAIFWYVTIFNNGGLCLNPSKTFVRNIGFDGTGVHCTDQDIYIGELSQKSSIRFVVPEGESIVALERVKKFYKKQRISILQRIINKLRSLLE